MSDPNTLAANYRKRAQTLRSIAEMDSNRETRQTLIKIAQNYERMADDLEAIDQTNREFEQRSQT